MAAPSIWLSLISAIFGFPYGGGKDEIVVNPQDLLEQKLEEREYIGELEPFTARKKGILSPDVNTIPQIMGCMINEFSRMNGKNVPETFTGSRLY